VLSCPEAPAPTRSHGLDRRPADLDEVSQVFRLVWPAAEVQVRPTPSGVAVDLRLDTLSHHIMVAAELASEGEGLRLVREIFKGRVPERLSCARQSLTLMLASETAAAHAPAQHSDQVGGPPA
jgi:hypothetical protein